MPFSILKRKITLNHPKSADKGFFLGTRVQNSRGKQAISVQATEVLLSMVLMRGNNVCLF